MSRTSLVWMATLVGVFSAACSSSSGGSAEPTEPEVGGGASGGGGTSGGSKSEGGGDLAATGGGTSDMGGSLDGGGGAAGMGGVGHGGAGNAGGSGGAGGAAPHTVGKCDGLGAVGKWEEISATAFHTPNNMETTCVGVDPIDQSVYAAAGNKTNGGNAGTGVYQSADCGATWTKVSVTANLETGDCFGFLIDPVQPRNMYYANGYGNNPTLYKSTDGGINWTPLMTDASHVLTYGFVDKFAIDPGAPDHLVVTYHEDCKAPYAPQCMAETPDGGATWRQFKGPDIGFAEGNRVAMTGKTTWFYSSTNGGWFTGDAGQSWERVVNGSPADIFVGTDSAYLAVYNSGIWKSQADATAQPPTALGESWKLLANSPSAANVASDGVTVFASADYAPQPFSTAAVSSPSVWMRMPSPTIGRRTNQFAYDADHHILYSANIGAGLWRLVTR